MGLVKQKSQERKRDKMAKAKAETKPEKKSKEAPETKKTESKGGGSITLNCKGTREAITQIRGALGTDLQNLYIKFGKEAMRIGASSPSLALVVDVAGCSGKGEFGVNAESFQRILQKRNSLDCLLSDSNLSFSENRFKGEITVFPYLKIDVQPEASEKTITIPHNSGIAQHFNTSRNNLALSDTLAQGKEPFLSVIVGEGKIVCLVYDMLHAGLYSADLEYEGEFEFNILDSTLRKIAAMTRKEVGYTLLIGESSVFVESENVKASISMTQSSSREAKPLIEMMQKMQKKENVLASAPLPTEGLSDVVNNMMGIVEAQKVIDFRIKDGEVSVKYETTFGKIEESFDAPEAKGKEKVSLTPDTLLDILGVIPTGNGKVMVTQHPDSRNKSKQLMISLPDEKLTYVMLVK